MPFGSGNQSKPAASAARPTAPRGAPPAASRYAGVAARGARLQYPPAGYYRFKLLESVEGYNPNKKRHSNKVKVEVIATEVEDPKEAKAGDRFSMTFLDTEAGVGEFKALVMSVTGFDPKSQEVEFDDLSGPSQDLVAAVAGHANQFSEERQAGIGRYFDCLVTKGSSILDPKTGADTGDYYRGYTFEAVPEAEQPEGVPPFSGYEPPTE